MLLDLNAAFDTVDQDKLLCILRDEIGVKCIALKWLESVLKCQTQTVKIGDVYSDEKELKHGVPQGSVLGPDLFNIYIRSLRKYVEPRARFDMFGFADDHQLMKCFLPAFQVKALGEDIRNCFTTISKWMNEFFLCLNPGKTKILIITPPPLEDKICIQGTFIDKVCMRFVDSAKNLGIVIELTVEPQVDKLVKSWFLVIRKISKIKSYLTDDQLRTVISTCVFSRLDYCNPLYYGISSTTC